MRQIFIITIMICLVWISVLPCNGQITIKDYTPVNSIDAEKMFAQPKVSWMVMHAYWPTDAFAAKHTYPGDVQLETEELIQLLDKVMRDEVEPSEEDIHNHLQAYTNLWEGSDYLILKYTTESGLRISVQEGSRLFVEVESSDQVPLTDVKDLVRRTALAVFDFSDVMEERRNDPIVAKWDVDIGSSAFGHITCGYHYRSGKYPDRKWWFPDWFTDINWWSDGKKVLFRVSRADYSKMKKLTSPLPDPNIPRIFKSRIDDMPPADCNMVTDQQEE